MHRVSAFPEVAAEVAKKKIDGIEAALAALVAVGITDGSEIQLLKDCFQKAKRSAQQFQFTQSEAFVERARKRLVAHDAARQQFVTELEESEARLVRLRQVAAHSPPMPPPVAGRTECVDRAAPGASRRLRVGQKLSPSHVLNGSTPQMPTVQMELSDWMQDRQSDMQDALNSGNFRRKWN